MSALRAGLSGKFRLEGGSFSPFLFGTLPPEILVQLRQKESTVPSLAKTLGGERREKKEERYKFTFSGTGLVPMTFVFALFFFFSGVLLLFFFLSRNQGLGS